MSAGRVRVAPVAVRRELGVGLLVTLSLTAAATVALAHFATSGLDAGPSLFDRALRRFDLTVLYLAVVIAIFRIAAHIEQDERTCWLDGFVAAGASRPAYVNGVAAGALTASAALFVAAAVIHAGAAYAFAQSTELLVILPRTLGSGLLMLLHWSAWMTLSATLLRRALPAFIVGVMCVALPFALLTMQLQRTDQADAWLVWLVRLTPPLVPADNAWLAAVQITATCAFALLGRFAAAAFIGRHT